MSAALKTALVEYTTAQGGADGLFLTPIKGLALMKTSKEILPYHMIYKPALCVVGQGAKQVSLGDQVLDYAEGQALLVGVELPAFGRVTRATATEPYIGLTLEFDVGLMRGVMETLHIPPRPNA